jgi:hypothetical protein
MGDEWHRAMYQKHACVHYEFGNTEAYPGSTITSSISAITSLSS